MRTIQRFTLLTLALGAPMFVAAACSSSSETTDTGSTGSLTGSGAGSGAGGLSGAGGATTGSASGGNTGTGGGSYTGSGGVPTQIATCQGKTYQCGDLVDNDNDGLIDSQDPDCLGPCDNTEGSYAGGIPGQNAAPCKMDCYFDQDTGSGNDDCYWSHKCDSFEQAPDYYPEPSVGDQCEYDTGASIPGTGNSCDQLFMNQSQLCLDYCGPLTPNGCDCFGCCELPAGQGNYVWLGSLGVDGTTVCTADKIDGPTVCHPCTPVDACLNGCETCELCLGKTELPPECYPPDGGSGGSSTSSGGTGGSGGTPPPQTCPPGYAACGLPGQDPCGPGTYCITGCCAPIPA
jgi:hypothetical protein